MELLGNEGLCKLLIPYEDKTAEAVCTIGYSSGPGSEPVLFQGRLVVYLFPVESDGIYLNFNRAKLFLNEAFLLLVRFSVYVKSTFTDLTQDGSQSSKSKAKP